VFALQEIDGDKFEGYVLLPKDHPDPAGASGGTMSVEFQHHCDEFVWYLVWGLVSLTWGCTSPWLSDKYDESIVLPSVGVVAS
jgi:hypothetical protein